MALAPVILACRLLALPEGPTHRELQKQARVYLAELNGDEYRQLREEATSDRDKEAAEQGYLDKLEILKRLQFTDREAQAYARMRLDSPGVRRVIARRALLIKLLKRELPSRATFYEVARMEDSFLAGLSDEQVLQQLGLRS